MSLRFSFYDPAKQLPCLNRIAAVFEQDTDEKGNIQSKAREGR